MQMLSSLFNFLYNMTLKLIFTKPEGNGNRVHVETFGERGICFESDMLTRHQDPTECPSGTSGFKETFCLQGNLFICIFVFLIRKWWCIFKRAKHIGSNIKDKYLFIIAPSLLMRSRRNSSYMHGTPKHCTDGCYTSSK